MITLCMVGPFASVKCISRKPTEEDAIPSGSGDLD
jgi:hypothetical protein